MGWRVFAIAIALIISVIASEIIYWGFGWGHDPSTLFGAVFASWLGGLALFVVIGLIVALVSIARPEEESFDARARILFRRQIGPHIDYIVSKLKEIFEHYSQRVTIRVAVNDYHAGEKKFLVSIDVLTVVRSYIDDIASTYASTVKISDVTDPPAGKDGNRVHFLRINQTVQPDCCKTFQKEFIYPFNTEIDRDKRCFIEYKYQKWVRAPDEDNKLRLVRYTQDLILTFENVVSGGVPMTVELSQDGGGTWDRFTLGPGEAQDVLRKSNLQPWQEIYRYRLLPI